MNKQGEMQLASKKLELASLELAEIRRKKYSELGNQDSAPIDIDEMNKQVEIKELEKKVAILKLEYDMLLLKKPDETDKLDALKELTLSQSRRDFEDLDKNDHESPLM